MMKTGVTFCDPMTAMQHLDDNPVLHAFHAQPTGRELDIGEWDVDRLHDPLVRSVTYEGEMRWNGRRYDVVQWVYEQAWVMPADTAVYTTRVLIGDDQLVRRVSTTSSKGYHWDSRVLQLTLDAPIPDATFSWKPSAGTTVTAPKLPPPEHSEVGEAFPTFTGGQLLNGTVVTSAQLLSGHRATLVWFWNTQCSSCDGHMPRMEQLYHELRGQNVQVVAVNVFPVQSSEIEYARIYQRFHHITMPILFGAPAWGNWLDTTSWFAVLDEHGTVVSQNRDNANFTTIRTALRRMTDSAMPSNQTHARAVGRNLLVARP
jgi:thiol-disulfide isomerase/thioredoxin